MPRRSDAGQILEIYAPFCEATPVSFETEPPSVDEMRQRINKTLESLPWLVCEQQGRVLGYAYASRHRERAGYRWSVDVSVYVRDGHRGRGLGRALYSSLFAILRLQGFYNILAGISLPNPASVALHESMGLRPIGVYPRHRLQVRRSGTTSAGGSSRSAPPDGEPEEPRELPFVRDLDECNDALAAGRALLERERLPHLEHDVTKALEPEGPVSER